MTDFTSAIWTMESWEDGLLKYWHKELTHRHKALLRRAELMSRDIRNIQAEIDKRKSNSSV
jgi:hypothetical protein